MFMKLSLILVSVLAAPLNANPKLSPTKIKALTLKAINAGDLKALRAVVDKYGILQVDSKSMQWLDGGGLLHYAIDKGSLEMVKYLFWRGVRVYNIKNHRGETPLNKAIASGKIDIIALLKNSINADLRWTARIGDIESVGTKLKNGADIHAKDKYGMTALMYAAAWGKEAVVALLLRSGAGAGINDKDKYGWTALTHAVMHIGAEETKYAEENAVATVKQLIGNGANIHAQDNNGMNPLEHALRKGEQEMVDMLRESGGIDFVLDRSSLRISWKEKTADKAAIEDNTSANQWKDDLHSAVRAEEDIESLYDLLRRDDLNIDVPNEDGQTPLMVAAYWGNRKAVALLLTNGADIHARDNNRQTPLTHAVLSDSILGTGIIMKLVANGANIHAQDNNEETPHILLRKGDQKLADRLYYFEKNGNFGIEGGLLP